MNICYLSASAVPSTSANSIQVMKMCAAMAAQGHQVHLFAKTVDSAADPFAFYGVPNSFTLHPQPRARHKLHKHWLRWQWQRHLQCLNPQLLYARSRPALEKALFLNVPLVFEAHYIGDNPERYRRLFRHPCFQRLVVISAALGEDFLAAFPELDPAKIRVAHDGADPVPAAESAPSKTTTALQVGYVGHLYAGKGMEIIAQLPTHCPAVDFHVVGGRDEDLQYWQQQLAGVDNLRFHGFVPHAQTADFIRRFDVVLAPYQQRVSSLDGNNIGRWMSPLKLFEYMAHGKAIIASDLPVLREILSHDHNALLVAPDDPYAWQAALQRLQQDPLLRQRLGEQARRDFLASYAWPSRARQVLAGLDPDTANTVSLSV